MPNHDWLDVHRTAHKLGMRTTATMMFGVGDTFEHRINHFQRIYELQEETAGFTAFIPWSFQPGNTALGGRHWKEATAVEYLKVLAIAPPPQRAKTRLAGDRGLCHMCMDEISPSFLIAEFLNLKAVPGLLCPEAPIPILMNMPS